MDLWVPFLQLFLFHRLSSDAKKDIAVKHALSVRSAVTSGNYVMFFRLYKTAPNLNTILMGEPLMILKLCIWIIKRLVLQMATINTYIENICHCRSLCWKNAICCCKMHISFIPSYGPCVVHISESRLLKCNNAYEWIKWRKRSGRSGGVHGMAKSSWSLPYFRQLWGNITRHKGNPPSSPPCPLLVLLIFLACKDLLSPEFS